MVNQLNASIDATTLQDVKDAIASINTKLPFLVGLESQDYRKLAKMVNLRSPFVDQALTLSRNNPDLEPKHLKLEDGIRNFNLRHDLDEIAFAIAQLNTKLEHTRALAGNGAYTVALDIYDTVKKGDKKGLAGMKAIREQLKVFFEKLGRKKGNKKNPPQT